MKQSRVKIARVIADRALKKGVNKHLSKEVAAYLLNERRGDELDSIMRDVQADWAETGHVEVLARSASPLSATVRNDISRLVKRLAPEARRVLVTEIRDPEVIGGLRLDLANRQLDLSVQSKLNKFKQLAVAGKED